jgi:hypothetical protein
MNRSYKYCRLLRLNVYLTELNNMFLVMYSSKWFYDIINGCVEIYEYNSGVLV